MAETPIMCTLSQDAMAERLSDFAALFTETLTAYEREPLRLRLTFAGADAGRRARIRALFEAERRCCAFLTFTYEQDGADLTVDVAAPTDAGPTLDDLAGLAEHAVPAR
ncbi:MAG TPA: hypothetical protein VHJ17_02740 [Thermomonospora sp.]|nr:hypothetical protein [Thermomonospora sp.]